MFCYCALERLLKNKNREKRKERGKKRKKEEIMKYWKTYFLIKK